MAVSNRKLVSVSVNPPLCKGNLLHSITFRNIKSIDLSALFLGINNLLIDINLSYTTL